MWKMLVVPHDFSPCADRALRLAAALAKVHGSKILLLHVSELPASLAPTTLLIPEGETEPVRADAYAMAGAERRLEGLAERVRRASIPVQTEAVVGSVESEILESIQRWNADALVMGTHGREGLAHWLVGSVTEKVVRRARVPVVCVRSAGEAELTREELAMADELAG